MGLIELESEQHALDAVQSEPSVLPIGALTKSHLSRGNNEISLLDCRKICGVSEYEPTEFTISAKAGTPISEINNVLSEHRQYLPFDAPFAESGSTLGGSIAAGLNGSSSLRFGGARDFVLGIQFIDGLGRKVTAGGKVVKNAAGFDLPKFFVGSYGRFGLLTEITLKVFPQPETFATLVFDGSLDSQISMIKKLILSPIEIDALDIFDSQLLIRLGGPEESVKTSCARIGSLLNQTPAEILNLDVDQSVWRQASQFSWHSEKNSVLIKVPCQINDVKSLAEFCENTNAKSRFAIGGQVAYFSVSDNEAAAELIRQLDSAGYRFVTLNGPEVSESKLSFGPFSQKVKNAIDPNNKFLSIK